MLLTLPMLRAPAPGVSVSGGEAVLSKNQRQQRPRHFEDEHRTLIKKKTTRGNWLWAAEDIAQSGLQTLCKHDVTKIGLILGCACTLQRSIGKCFEIVVFLDLHTLSARRHELSQKELEALEEACQLHPWAVISLLLKLLQQLPQLPWRVRRLLEQFVVHLRLFEL
ncbi:MAG: hypothetical protein FRX49_08160 [Trebouxia sp. A1-2]|nr:MAG: hypothetical protein FRX49_08160 [Trebouxia sp. A1-2]